MMTVPQTGTFIELDPVAGWQAVSMTNLSPIDTADPAVNCITQQPVANKTASAGLTVGCVTGQPTAFLPTLSGELHYPVALAYSHRKLYVLDDAMNRVKTLNLEYQNQYFTNDGFGGKGEQARHFRNPRGLAVLDDSSFVVADTGNEQVKIFSRYPNALLSVWGSGAPGDAPGDFNKPWKVVADRCGLIYIADRGNGRIQRILRNGSSQPPLLGLQNPTDLALAADGTLAVLDGGNIYIYPPGQTALPPPLNLPAFSPSISVSPSCLTFDNHGYLYVGASTSSLSALVFKFAAQPNGTYGQVGIGVTGVVGQFLDLLWTPDVGLVAILLKHCATAPSLYTIPICGTYLKCGTLLTQTLDSGIENCVWDRIKLHGCVPKGTVIQVTTQTANCDSWGNSATLATESSVTSQSSVLTLTGENPDCLVQSLPGRYLRAQFVLQSNGVVAPTLNSIQVSYPRSSYLQYLPAVYQEDDQSRVFLDRFLRIFQSTFDGLDQKISDMWMMFDPLSVPDVWFDWLADWIALPLNPFWTDTQRRTALKSAGQIYPKRGTPPAVTQLIQQYAGVDARLIEHFKLRQLIILPDQADPCGVALGTTTRLWSRDYYKRLQLGVYSRVGYFDLTGEPEPDMEPLAWGANEFTVFFDCEPYQVACTQGNVSQVVEREKPAYTKAFYAPVFPRMRVGVQSTLGVDSRIGEYTPLMLGTTGTLDYDSILGCSRTEAQLMAQHATLRPQIDVNTRLM
jgi:phage tail-like protein